ncbi:maleate cis-trans isomerase family protein [Rathayibacter soli]|uniref:maleate cis-trans isomerase family protein n=1 Tax=Rathayibacter soli TaxID=3144168 RepID=UPI0027E44DFD|nr:Asp/Glu racemase [Glaciibacter superstes]
MIVPSSNTCLEPQSYRILGARTDVTLHFARIDVTRIAMDADSDHQFDLSTMIAAATLLKPAEVDVIAWNGTSGSWLGAAYDRELVAHITAATGIPATTSALAYFDAYKEFGISEIAVVSPYTLDVNAAIAQQYAKEGLHVISERHLGLVVNESFARVAPEDLIVPSHEVAGGRDGKRPDTIIYLCTNLYGAPIVEQVERETNLPVLDSVAVTLWKCLTMLGLKGLEQKWGRLLS